MNNLDSVDYFSVIDAESRILISDLYRVPNHRITEWLLAGVRQLDGGLLLCGEESSLGTVFQRFLEFLLPVDKSIVFIIIIKIKKPADDVLQCDVGVLFTVVGRRFRCDINLNRPFVSRFHGHGPDQFILCGHDRLLSGTYFTNLLF